MENKIAEEKKKKTKEKASRKAKKKKIKLGDWGLYAPYAQ